MQAKATFKIVRAKEVPFSAIKGGPQLAQRTAKITYRGDLQGEGILTELRVYYSETSATIYGLERITGRLGDKAGSFVLEHDGTIENGVTRSKRTVLPGAGTGDLAGLRGRISYQSSPEAENSVTFEYDFAPLP